jgi:predicted DNA-binding transcriptional regulator YafY
MLLSSARLLRLLTLLQSRGFWTGAELAERLEITERTVRRDVERLRSLGYPVRSSTGVAGGYQLGAGASLPPLLLEDDEALAVVLGLRTAAAGTVAGLEEPAVRAMAKLEQMLPVRLRRRVDAMHKSVVSLYHERPRVQSKVLSALAGACRNNERASFRYDDAQGRASRRTVEPHGLVHTGSRWYLVAWDDDREDWRTFRIDRIHHMGHVDSADKTGRRFTPRKVPGGDVGKYVSRSIATRPYAHQARIVFHAPLSRVAERVPPLTGSLERIDDDHCRMEAGAQSLDRLALYVMLVGEDFEVEEPPELVGELRKLSARIRRATRRRDAAVTKK